MGEVLDYLSVLAKGIGGVQISTTFVTLVIGILNCFFGYRLVKAWIGVSGFSLGASLAYWLVSHYTRNSLAQIGAILAGGLILGLLAFYIYRVGVFLFCAGIGVAAAGIFLQPQPKGILKTLLCLGIGLLIGLLGMVFVKPMVILNTALGGGFSVAASVSQILKKEADIKILILGTVLFLAGIVVQALSSRNQDQNV